MHSTHIFIFISLNVCFRIALLIAASVKKLDLTVNNKLQKLENYKQIINSEEEENMEMEEENDDIEMEQPFSV